LSLFRYVEKISNKADTIEILRVLEKPCCQDQCCSKLPIRSFKNARELYWGKDPERRKEFILNAVSASNIGKKSPGGRGPAEERHFVDGVPLCINGWCINGAVSMGGVSMGGAKYTASPHHGLSVFYFVYRLYCIQITITGVSIKTGTARNKRNVKETYKQYKDQ